MDCHLGMAVSCTHYSERPSPWGSRQHDHLIEIKTMLSRRRFLDVITNPVDDQPRSIGIAHDTAERFPDLAQA